MEAQKKVTEGPWGKRVLLEDPRDSSFGPEQVYYEDPVHQASKRRGVEYFSARHGQAALFALEGDSKEKPESSEKAPMESMSKLQAHILAPQYNKDKVKFGSEYTDLKTYVDQLKAALNKKADTEVIEKSVIGLSFYIARFETAMKKGRAYFEAKAGLYGIQKIYRFFDFMVEKFKEVNAPEKPVEVVNVLGNLQAIQVAGGKLSCINGGDAWKAIQIFRTNMLSYISGCQRTSALYRHGKLASDPQTVLETLQSFVHFDSLGKDDKVDPNWAVDAVLNDPNKGHVKNLFILFCGGEKGARELVDALAVLGRDNVSYLVEKHSSCAVLTRALDQIEEKEFEDGAVDSDQLIDLACFYWNMIHLTIDGDNKYQGLISEKTFPLSNTSAVRDGDIAAAVEFLMMLRKEPGLFSRAIIMAGKMFYMLGPKGARHDVHYLFLVAAAAFMSKIDLTDEEWLTEDAAKKWTEYVHQLHSDPVPAEPVKLELLKNNVDLLWKNQWLIGEALGNAHIVFELAMERKVLDPAFFMVYGVNDAEPDDEMLQIFCAMVQKAWDWQFGFPIFSYCLPQVMSPEAKEEDFVWNPKMKQAFLKLTKEDKESFQDLHALILRCGGFVSYSTIYDNFEKIDVQSHIDFLTWYLKESGR